jgi:hypothetical protein
MHDIISSLFHYVYMFLVFVFVILQRWDLFIFGVLCYYFVIYYKMLHHAMLIAKYEK